MVKAIFQPKRLSTLILCVSTASARDDSISVSSRQSTGRGCGTESNFSAPGPQLAWRFNGVSITSTREETKGRWKETKFVFNLVLVLVLVIEFESVHQNSHSTQLGPLAPAP